MNQGGALVHVYQDGAFLFAWCELKWARVFMPRFAGSPLVFEFT
jgi:hypothetical protein